jgi:drug/metabolite transporter (DMT)-like permease
LCHLGGGTLFAALFYFPLLRRRLHIVSLLLGLLLAAAGCLFLREAAGYNRVNSLLTAAFLLNISFFLVSQILEALPRLRERRLAKESLFLLAWLGVVVATQFSGIHAAAKYTI